MDFTFFILEGDGDGDGDASSVGSVVMGKYRHGWTFAQNIEDPSAITVLPQILVSTPLFESPKPSPQQVYDLPSGRITYR